MDLKMTLDRAKRRIRESMADEAAASAIDKVCRILDEEFAGLLKPDRSPQENMVMHHSGINSSRRKLRRRQA